MAKNARVLRIAGELQRVLAQLVSREVKDPRVGSVTITAVDLAPDLSEARIFFLPFGTAHAAADVQIGLRRASGFLRGEIGRALSLRHAPRLEFIIDEQFDRADKLAALIDKAVKSDHAAAIARGDAPLEDAAGGEPEPR
ncbi:MAG TPA: 30S ribosome-binding factor RbfA [Steroidobacteraceae bacterium]